MQSAQGILKSLRMEPLFMDRGKKLISHPFIRDVKEGALPLKAVQKFLREQFYIIKANIKSMKHLEIK